MWSRPGLYGPQCSAPPCPRYALWMECLRHLPDVAWFAQLLHIAPPSPLPRGRQLLRIPYVDHPAWCCSVSSDVDPTQCGHRALRGGSLPKCRRGEHKRPGQDALLRPLNPVCRNASLHPAGSLASLPGIGAPVRSGSSSRALKTCRDMSSWWWRVGPSAPAAAAAPDCSG